MMKNGLLSFALFCSISCSTLALTNLRILGRLVKSTSLSESVASKERETSTFRNAGVPLSWDEMTRQAASAMKEAAAQGYMRQVVRVLLPRDSTSNNFGKFFESRSSPDDGDWSTLLKLVPPDESWQGGIMQLYRSAAPTAAKIIQKLTFDKAGGVPPRVIEDRSVDESGVDGVSLFRTDDKTVSCWLQPTQDNVDVIVDMAESAGSDTLVALMNPQWRLVDDALDDASRNGGFFGGLASFLGGKGGTLRKLGNAGFKPVYTLEGYVCRGANVRLLQILDSDWSVFCERDDGESFVKVGSASNRPSYQMVDEMLNESNIGFKYARDIGIAPKL